MSFRTRSLGIAAVFLSLLAGTPQAFAADLDPALEDAPQVMPSLPQSNVLFGSGWYVRGDIAVTDDYKVTLTRPSTDTFSESVARSQDATYNASLGGGYSFTNQIRGDIVADFFHPSQTMIHGEQCINNTASNSCYIQGEFNHYDALANVYYDFGTWSIVTPYIGAGAGVAFGNVKAQLLGDTLFYQGYVGYHNFAWALMAGLAFDVYPHVKLDVGYRYVNNGTVSGTQVYDHEIRAGLRYMIDN